MDCLRMRKNISKYLDGELSEDEAHESLEHIGSCPDCKQGYEAMKTMLDALKPPAEVFAPPHLFVGIRQKMETQRYKPVLVRRLKPVLAPVFYSLVFIVAIFAGSFFARDIPHSKTADSATLRLTLELNAFDDAPSNSFSSSYESLMLGE